jgi:hypothetical protein
MYENFVTALKKLFFLPVSGHERIEIQDLPSELVGSNLNSLSKDFSIKIPVEGIDLELEKAKYEFSCIEEALQRSSGRKKEAWKLLGLNDRFALRRRVLSLAKRFPSLMEAYPLTRASFFKKGSATPTYSRSD